MSQFDMNKEAETLEAESSVGAGKWLSGLVAKETAVGDLLSLDYDEATILVHDHLRQKVGGLPMGCFLLATRIEPDSGPDANNEDTALILLRVVGHSALSNQADTAKYRLDAALRAVDTSEFWDADKKTDQFTLNQLRHAGVHCKILGTFRMSPAKNGWALSFGADISNFYSGQGMKVYKPKGNALDHIVNFTKPMGDLHPLAGDLVEIGRVRYCSSEIKQGEAEETVRVQLDPTDLLARRTALFGMSRTGKSNTIKTVASAIFKLRGNKQDPEKGRVGQLIFDVNGEYCNDNPQDSGCLRNVWRAIGGSKEEHVATYGLFKHPYDKGRNLIKVNFLGQEPEKWDDLSSVKGALTMLFAGKSIIDEHFSADTAIYVRSLLNTSIEPPVVWDKSAPTRYRRNVTVYRAILAYAGFAPPRGLEKAKIEGLFGEELRKALKCAGTADNNYLSVSNTFEKPEVSWGALYRALVALQEFMLGSSTQGSEHPQFATFNQKYEKKHGKPWGDDTLRGLLGFLKGTSSGPARLRNVRERHGPNVDADYSDKIVADLLKGKLVIVDQSIGSPTENEYSSERIMKALFNRQRQVFIDPPRDGSGKLILDENNNIKPPADVVVYVEEAHNLLPAKNADLKSIWARVAKEGSKFRIGLVYSTQEPSSILSNILKNTDNWFVAHLNNQDEVRELKKYYDFEMFSGQILKVPDTGFLRMRCLSNPYIVPVQVNKFEAPRDKAGEEQSDAL
ncbi:MAG: DUF87 domain-containing protein [Gammaproteobacteria bacterium]|nr:DUF87 domain-containing protein [Gammaproteobacteria bacterium]